MSTTMTPPAPPAPGDVAFLDELLRAEDLRSSRDDEAAAVAQRLLHTSSPIVVLHGPAQSGKTDLVRRRIVPLVAQHRRVRFHTDAAVPPGAGETGTVEVWDDFESALTDDDAGRAEVVRQLSRAIEGAGESRMVLVVSDDAIERVYQLASAVPRLVEDVVALPRIAERPLFERIRLRAAEFGVNCSESFFAAVSRELKGEHAAVTAELGAILLFEIGRLKPSGGEASAEYLESRGGLAGLLEAHLNWLLDRLAGTADADVAWAVLSDIAGTGADGSTPPDLTSIEVRFDVPQGTATAVLRWLEYTRRIVQRRASGEYVLVPPQLALAIRAREGHDAAVSARHRELLRRAIRRVQDVEAVVSERAFRQIHADRTRLKVGDEEAAVMLRCAIAYENPTAKGVTQYWLRRVSDPDRQIDILLEAVFDNRSEVRRRAARHLGAWARPAVRNQLQLLALRDPDDRVRAQATDSLALIKDDDLLASLVRELEDRNSPYRTQAIDVLRIFHAQAATDALLRIVSAPESEPDGARQRAIEALGRQETDGAVRALLQIAVQGRSATDREHAAQTLAVTRSRETLRRTLDQLHQLTVAARASRPAISWRAALLWPANTILALGAASANLVVPGFVLLTIRRWRSGLLLSIGWAAFLGVMVLVGTDTPEPAVGSGGLPAHPLWRSRDEWLLLTGLLVPGLLMLVPFQVLVNERKAGLPAGWYRRALGGVVLACCLPMFLVFHGLGCALAKRWRRGLELMAFEGFGIMLIAGAFFIRREFDAYSAVSGVFGWTSTSLTIAGAALLTATFLLGVKPVWLDAFGFRRRREQLRRIERVTIALSPNPVVPEILLADCVGAAKPRARWSRGLLRRFSRQMSAGLRDCWERAEASARRAMVAIVARHPDAESMAFLEAAARALDWRARVRYRWACVTRGMESWPKPLVLAAAIVLYVQVAALAVLVTYRVNQPEELAQRAQNYRRSDASRLEATSRLGLLARQTADPLLAKEAVEMVGGLLTAPDSQRGAVATLRDVGTAEAAARLAAFIETPISRRAAETEEIANRRAAIAALATMRFAGAVDALIALRANAALRPELTDAVEAAFSDALLQAESELRNGRYAEAIASADRVLAEHSTDAGRALDASRVLVAAHTALGLIALQDSQYADAATSLRAALGAASTAGGDAELVALGLGIAFHYHERQGPQDPAGYAQAYAILDELRNLRGELPADSSTSILTNLAEASLTTGRYDQAVRLSDEVIDREGDDPGTTLTLLFIRYAALVLSGQEAADARADLIAYQRGLPPTFRNTWTYTGTRAFIQEVTTPVDKGPLLELLGTIEAGT
jgi:hypothetical protein